MPILKAFYVYIRPPTYWIICGLYIVKPRAAYHFMELVEGHAFRTYNKFLKENEATLKAQPAPAIAIQYYRDGDLYMFDEFQSSRTPEERRPIVNNLYDVFLAIRDDEQEHVKTMVACQHLDAKVKFKSPHTEPTVVVLATETASETPSIS